MVVQDNSLCLVFLMNLKCSLLCHLKLSGVCKLRIVFSYFHFLIFTAGKGSGRPTEVNENDE